MKKVELFGEVAIRLGFAKPKDVQNALRIQQAQKEQGKKHRLIGLIMLNTGVLGTTELIAILKEIEKRQKGKKVKVC